jgi:hypothetical protein
MMPELGVIGDNMFSRMLTKDVMQDERFGT